jgi:hypothetical protein
MYHHLPGHFDSKQSILAIKVKIEDFDNYIRFAFNVVSYRLDVAG